MLCVETTLLSVSASHSRAKYRSTAACTIKQLAIPNGEWGPSNGERNQRERYVLLPFQRIPSLAAVAACTLLQFCTFPCVVKTFETHHFRIQKEKTSALDRSGAPSWEIWPRYRLGMTCGSNDWMFFYICNGTYTLPGRANSLVVCSGNLTECSQRHSAT
jgi:hypothetical protein